MLIISSNLPITGLVSSKISQKHPKVFSHETQRLPATNSRIFRGRLFYKAPGCDARSGTSRCRSNISKDLPAAAERWGFSGWGIEMHWTNHSRAGELENQLPFLWLSNVIYLYCLVIFHIAMEIHYKWRFIAGKIIDKWAMFRCYVTGG